MLSSIDQPLGQCIVLLGPFTLYCSTCRCRVSEVTVYTSINDVHSIPQCSQCSSFNMFNKNSPDHIKLDHKPTFKCCANIVDVVGCLLFCIQVYWVTGRLYYWSQCPFLHHINLDNITAAVIMVLNIKAKNALKCPVSLV